MSTASQFVVRFVINALLCAGLFVEPSIGFAQTENLDARYPKLKEGQLFTVKLIPGAKELQVFLAGHKQAEVRLTDVGFEAYVRGSGGKMKPLTATNKGTYFSIPAPTSTDSELRLKLDYQGAKEEYQFPLK
ncbi:MAG: hypothetical protein NDI61_11665 [Bdellovibrionaceae bacterium]|nr:hypothetical protein [Pseudobdellovibrionaceae bacterium]